MAHNPGKDTFEASLQEQSDRDKASTNEATAQTGTIDSAVQTASAIAEVL